MKKFTGSLVIALCLCATLLMSGAIFSKAQYLTAEKKSVSKAFTEIIRQKRETGSFVLLTPEDLSKISANELEAALVNGDPCETAEPISFGQTVNGQLSSADCRLDDNSYADFYYFNGTQGQQVTAAMNSTAFDTYLGLANETGSFVVEDDDGGGGTNSRIIATLPETGLYIILANSAFANQFGNYSVSLTGSVVCSFSFEPTAAQVPAAGGNFSFTVNTQPNCSWSASSTSNDYWFLRTSSTGTGTGIVEYSIDPNGESTVRTGTIRVGNQSFTITQPPLVCSYSINPTSANVPVGGITGSLTITAPDGCPWSSYSRDYFISTGSSGRGTGTVNYIVSANNGADRTGKLTVNGLDFAITQPGRNCTYSVSPTNISVNRAEHRGTLNVTTQPGCTWAASAGYSFIEYENNTGVGPGTISYRIFPHTSFVTRTFVSAIFADGVTTTMPRVTFTQTGFPFRTRYDFDGDSKADLGFFRPSNGEWLIHNSQTNSVSPTQFGMSGDLIAPADFDGDRLTDIAVFRPSNGVWYWLNSSNNSFSAVQFGMAGDIPVAADYDGDNKADIAVFRPSNGTWYFLNSSSGQFSGAHFGISEDKPQVGDYDGDRKADLAVFRPSTGIWYVLRSSNGSFFGVNWGLEDDIPVPADYDGDGKTDLTVYRPSESYWYSLYSSNGQVYAEKFGLSEDIPVPADYDADGRTDIAVFRPSTGMWWSLRTLYNSPTGNPFIVNDGFPITTKFQ
jgi:FG-GAP-like repeat/FG-GAP repeat